MRRAVPRLGRSLEASIVAAIAQPRLRSDEPGGARVRRGPTSQEKPMIRDARDVAHSTTSDLAIQHYETAVAQFQSYRGGRPRDARRGARRRPVVRVRAPVKGVRPLHADGEEVRDRRRGGARRRARARVDHDAARAAAARRRRPAGPLRVGRRVPHVRRGAGRAPARRRRAADGPPDGLRPRRRAQPAQPGGARPAPLERAGSGYSYLLGCWPSASRSATSTRKRSARRAARSRSSRRMAGRCTRWRT